MPISMKSLTRNASQAYVICNYLSGLCQRLGREHYMRSFVRLQHGPGTGFFGVSNTGSTDCVKERFRGITDSLEQTNKYWGGIDFISESCIDIDAPDFRNIHRVEHTHEVIDLYRAFEESFIVPGRQFSANDIAVFIVRNQIVCLIRQVEQRPGWSFDHALPFSKYSRKIFFNGDDISEFSVAELIAINDIRYANLLESLRGFDFTTLNAINSTRLTGDGNHTMPAQELAERYGEDEFELLTRHYRHKLGKRITPGSAWYNAVDAERYRKWLARRLEGDDQHAGLRHDSDLRGDNIKCELEIAEVMSMKENLPKWLHDWSPAAKMSMTDFFASRIVFYPGSGTDGQPVEFFGSRHAAHCFVYADYGIPREHVLQELGETGHPFAGYISAGRRELLEHDLTPNGWVPNIRPEAAQQGPLAPGRPYAFIEILQRLPGFDDAHGPQRLAILILCADGVAAYDSLFCQPKASAPFAVVLQDHGFGGNWTRFGQGGCLEHLASRTERLPQFLLVAVNTDAWVGYSAIDGATLGGGGIHGFERQLWQRSDHAGDTSIPQEPLNSEASEGGSARVVGDPPSQPQVQGEPPLPAGAAARPAAHDLFFSKIWDAPAASALIARVIAICEALHVRVHYTYKEGGDLRVEPDRQLPGPARRNVITMLWRPQSRHFHCEALLPPEECVDQGIPIEHVGLNIGHPLSSRLFVRPNFDEEAFLSIVTLSIRRFREQ